MIRKVQHFKTLFVKTEDGKRSTKRHFERHLVTTWYFLFFPIFTFSKVIDANI